ncbi:MAG: S9 family peptidase, partial [Bacteroidota bacterium]|nr:S9 family peptidase [Bacteroidota bacterium]
NSDIYLYNINKNETKNISAPIMGFDKNPVFSNDGSKIVWESMERDGYESDKIRIMVKDLNTGELVNYSQDFDQNAFNFVWADDDKSLYFISGIKATKQIFNLKFETNEINQITKGVHNYLSFDLADGFAITGIQSMSQPTAIYKTDLKTGDKTQISSVNNEMLDKITLGKVEKRWITTTDNKQMLTWIIYPPNFDANKKYPTLLYCQGGPQSAVSQFFSYRWNFQIMAANDYIIVAPNRRGLPSFGQEWNEQISKDYGGQNMKDYFSAIDALAEESYVDNDNLGAIGASYGGLSVFWIAGHHEKRFKAFIAHDGIFNFSSMYGSTEELWFVDWDLGGPYWDKTDENSYEDSPHLSVKNWDTPILIVQGGYDFRVPETQAFEAFTAAKVLGIDAELLYFPTESHFVLQPQNAILWQREFFGWLDKYLKN